MDKSEAGKWIKFYSPEANNEFALSEFEAFYVLVTIEDKKARQDWIYERLLREARKYKKKGISKDRWPQSLQSIPDEHIDNPYWRMGSNTSQEIGVLIGRR